jgi:endonuclease/exonuclease/phosphatase family metal-dependent hydrolase
LQTLLPEHQAWFRPAVSDIYGLGTFTRKNIKVLNEGDISIHTNDNYIGSGPTHSRNMQWLECKIDQQIYSILNVHGLWNGMGKTDTPERIAQSQRIRNFMDAINHPKILCGDLNLRPDTESLRLIEKNLQNHIQINKITSTRTSLYPKAEKYADYIFTSPEIKVLKFEVLKDEVSDHAPLLIEFT